MAFVPASGDPRFRAPIATLADFPTKGQLGEIRQDLSTGIVYTFNGSTWVPIKADSTGSGTIPLTVNHILVGQVSGEGGDVAMSGDVGIIANGTTTIANGAVTNAKIASGLDAAKIHDGSISNTEFSYLNNVSSNIQTQLDAKQATGNYITALTGDVTASGPGSAAATIGALKVTNGMLAGSIAYSKLILTGSVTNADLAGSIAYSKLVLTGAILNADLAGSISDSKLSVISTSGKISNSATTATSANTASAIVARDGSGNFSAGTITATISGNTSGTHTGQVTLPDGSVGTPSWNFTNSTGMGAYRISNNVLGFATAGTKRVTIDSNGITQEASFITVNNQLTGAPSGAVGGLNVIRGTSPTAQLTWQETNGGLWVVSPVGAGTTYGIVSYDITGSNPGRIPYYNSIAGTIVDSGLSTDNTGYIDIPSGISRLGQDGSGWNLKFDRNATASIGFNDPAGAQAGCSMQFYAQDAVSDGSTPYSGGSFAFETGTPVSSSDTGGDGGSFNVQCINGANGDPDVGFGGNGGSINFNYGFKGTGGFGNGLDGALNVGLNNRTSGVREGGMNLATGIRAHIKDPNYQPTDTFTIDCADYSSLADGYVNTFNIIGGKGGYDGDYGYIAGTTIQINAGVGGTGAADGQASDGGGFYINSGAGATPWGSSFTGGRGGTNNIASGGGGNANSDIGQYPGDAGDMQIVGGNGGDITGDDDNTVTGGGGGTFLCQGGYGGDVTGANTLATGGRGGALRFDGGGGGSTDAGVGGDGGNGTFVAGRAGEGTGTKGNGGSMYVNGGYCSDSTKIGKVYVGYDPSYGTLCNVAIRRSTAPTVALNIGGALAYDSTSVSLTADNQSVDTTNKSYLILSSNNATAANRTFTLTAGVAGQRLTIEWSGTNAGEIVASSTARLTATWTPTQYDTLSLIYSSNVSAWLETGRCANA